jgi:hypothetical protein
MALAGHDAFIVMGTILQFSRLADAEIPGWVPAAASKHHDDITSGCREATAELMVLGGGR